MTGYLHRDYAVALGAARWLPRSGGFAVEREIPGSSHRDAAAPYPLFCCLNWDALKLRQDLFDLNDLVSFVGVADPFAEVPEEAFDLVKPFKQHYVVTLNSPQISKHHRYYIRQADVTVGYGGTIDDWWRLYGLLLVRRQAAPHHHFSEEVFEAHFEVPGLTILKAHVGARVVGMHLWFRHGDAAYSHLAATDDEGYKRGAAYALHDAAIQHFKGKVSFLDLGGPMGYPPDYDSGLARFKRGWSDCQRTAYLVGAVLQPQVYDELSKGKTSDYFPRYRG